MLAISIANTEFYCVAFGHVLICQLCPCPIMALTPTATPSVRQQVIGHLDNPVTSIATMNQPNIFYEVHLLKSCQGTYVSVVLMIIVSLLLHSEAIVFPISCHPTLRAKK